jgi:hypothetical protein
MTFFFGFLLALVLSIIFFVVLYQLVLKGIQAQKRFGWLFLAFVWFALFLPTWAGGLWLRPFGPSIGGVTVWPYVLVGAAFALILGALLPRPQPAPERGPNEQRLSREEVLSGQRQEDWSRIGWVFGIFFAFMIAAIIAGMLG